MRVAFHTVYPAAATELWNRVFPTKYAVDEQLIRQNTVDHPLYDPGASVAMLDDDGRLVGYIVIKRSASGLYRGPDPDEAHVSAVVFDDPTVGVDLFAHAKQMLLNRGIYKVRFGQDMGHFWPGCPEECSALRSYLTVTGFQETDSAADVESDLSGYEPPSGCLEALSGATVRPLTLEDRAALQDFFDRTFPGRWRVDTLAKADKEGRLDFVYGLWIEGKIEGFALTQDWTHAYPIAGGVWKASLGGHWGSLGPIGVSEAFRGRGLGGALLGAALIGMKERGVERAIIDWTTLVDFYAKHGFEPVRRYTGFTLRLDG